MNHNLPIKQFQIITLHILINPTLVTFDLYKEKKIIQQNLTVHSQSDCWN